MYSKQTAFWSLLYFCHTGEMWWDILETEDQMSRLAKTPLKRPMPAPNLSCINARRRRRPQGILRTRSVGEKWRHIKCQELWKKPFRETETGILQIQVLNAAQQKLEHDHFHHQESSSPRSSNTSFPAKLGIWDKILSMNPKRQIPSSSCCAYTVLWREHGGQL